MVENTFQKIQVGISQTTMDKASIEKLTEADWLNFEHKFQEVVQELRLKRDLLDESRKEVEKLTKTKHRLEQELEEERHKKEDSTVQLRMSLTAIKQLEDEKIKTKADQAKRNVQFDVFNKEQDLLLECLNNTKTENEVLRQTIEELESKVRNHKDFQNSVVSQQSKLTVLIDKVSSEIQILKEDQSQIRKMVVMGNAVGSQMRAATNYYESILVSCRKERSILEKKVIHLSTETEKLRSLNETILNEKEKTLNKSYIMEWKNCIQEYQNRLTAEKESHEEQKNMIEYLLKAQNQLKHMADEAITEGVHIKANLDNQKKYSDKLETELNLANIKINDIKHKLCLTEKSLKEQRKLNRKPESKERSMQTALLETETKGTMTEQEVKVKMVNQGIMTDDNLAKSEMASKGTMTEVVAVDVECQETMTEPITLSEEKSNEEEEMVVDSTQTSLEANEAQACENIKKQEADSSGKASTLTVFKTKMDVQKYIEHLQLKMTDKK